jgi:hypothetical protein
MEKFENHLQFQNIFVMNLRKRAQFSKHSVSFIRLSEPYVIVTHASESASCQLDLHLFQACKLHTCCILHTWATQCSAASQYQVVSITLAVNQIYQRCQI